MEPEYELPDTERREELTDLITACKAALDRIGSISRENHPEYEEPLGEVENRLEGVRSEARAERDEIPEWDTQLVRKLTTYYADRSDTNIRTVNNDIVFTFEVGEYGNETRLRYEVAVGAGNEWFFVEVDDGWEEVWSS